MEEHHLDIDTYGRINQKRYDNWIFRDLCGGRTNTSVKAYEVWTSFNPNGTWTGIATDITRNNNKSGADDFHPKNEATGDSRTSKSHTICHATGCKATTGSGQNAQVYVDLQNTLLLSN